MTKADLIADCVLKTFEALPSKCKPRILSASRREWVPLAGIVLSRVEASTPTLTCAALATGMKCLPQSKLGLANGNILHDWHAEVLAIRSLNRFLVDECASLANNGRDQTGMWVKWREENVSTEHIRQPFALQDDVEIHMYCSEAPCGDASMELTMAEQVDATPWEREQYVGPDGLLGRGNFDQLGIVRRKPSRPDAPQSLSKSCSDKLALKQCTSLLSGLSSLLISPSNAYLSTLILPEGQAIERSTKRAFSATGRMKDLANNTIEQTWSQHGYQFKAFEVQTTTKTFAFSKPVKGESDSAVPSNLSAMYTPHRQEILINGVLQGRKQTDPRGASCVSRRRMWAAIYDVTALVDEQMAVSLRAESYGEVKQSGLLEGRELVKREARSLGLKGWKRNEGDTEWTLVEG
ncbi:putative Acylphosphatase-like domain, adenosine deaminase/editase [Septoria linicola]|nr:putative Acylphosphatase-like domain, adenosine deaminase/editase [Septoria linicola]